MSTTKRVGAVFALVVFLLGGAWYVARMSAAQEALEAPPPDVTAELAQMNPQERAFVYEAGEIADPLDNHPANTLKLGYQACRFAGLPEYRIRDEVVSLSMSGWYELTKTEALIFWYRVKASGICAL